jgi:hypothetical protein
MTRSDTTIIDSAVIEAVLYNISLADLAPPIKPKTPPRQKGWSELSPGFRRVHVEGCGVEREPLEGEPYLIIERLEKREGDLCSFETTTLPYNSGKPPYGGPWELTALSPNGEWATWIRLVRGER